MMSESKMKMIIDCDTGVDDAQAILLALASGKVDLLAITCCTGNVSVDAAAYNTARVLQAAGVTDVPIYKGPDRSLLDVPILETQHSDATHYHGIDGLGDAPHATEGQVDTSVIKETYDAVELCKLINKYPREIILVATGPLTNIGMAFRMDSGIASKLKELYIMGGAIYGKGNVTVVGEFNTSKDPEAASIVLNEAVCPTYLFSWEMCCQAGVDWEWHANWINHNSAPMKFLNSIMTHTCNMDQEVWGTDFCPPDLVTMAMAIKKDIISKSDSYHCYVDCGGNPLTRGQLIVDWKHLLRKERNITVCLDWSVENFKEALMWLTK